MRKFFSLVLLSLALLVVCVATVSCSTTNVASAIEESGGYNLEGDYSVKITYSYCLRYGSGLYLGYEVIFDSDFYSTVQNKKELLNRTKETFVNNDFTVETDLENGKMNAFIKYDSMTDYYVQMGVDGYDVGTKSVPDKKTLFYSYYSSTYKTVFADLKTPGRFVNRIYNCCVDMEIPDENILLCYVYGTPYGESAITSTANSVRYSTSDKQYYHTFMFTVDEREKEITIYQKSPNAPAWYLLAIAVGLIVLAIPLTILTIKKKKEKRYGKQNG